MAISVYCGVMGSGKSYEAIKSIVVPAIASGRRVVTNISGVSEAAIHAYLVKRGHDLEKLGKVVHFENEALKLPGFFPCEASPEFKFDVPEWVPGSALRVYAESYTTSQGKTFGKTAFQALLPDLKRLHDFKLDLTSCLLEAAQKDLKTLPLSAFEYRPRGEPWMSLESSGPSVVQPGDLVVVDECWLFWSDVNKLDPEHMLFFRMHRHYVDEAGRCCDMLLIIQDFPSLNRFIRGVCELVVYFYKLKVFGLMDRYRIETFEGRPSKKSMISTSPWQKYKKEYFPLYKSYDGSKGKEGQIDSRQNLFKNKWFLFVMIAAVVGFVSCGIWFFRYVSNLRSGGVSSSSSNSLASTSYSGSPSVPGVAPASNVAPSASLSDYRLSGLIEMSSGETILILQSADGRLSRRRMNGGVVDGWQTVADIDGHLAGFQFGVKASK